jgi:lipid-A-disaccharide synthase-like uncharacterized protein
MTFFIVWVLVGFVLSFLFSGRRGSWRDHD